MKRGCKTCFKIFPWMEQKVVAWLEEKECLSHWGWGRSSTRRDCRSLRTDGCPVTHPKWCWSPSSLMDRYLHTAGAAWYLWTAWTEELKSRRPAETELSSHPDATRLKYIGKKNLPLCYLNMNFVLCVSSIFPG